uniref:Reverse transcriptase domain-containing protein n=1 Tax=Amphimedon queenslandica TaxID=400682 RepID=A0A1X7TGL7_AMPQE
MRQEPNLLQEYDKSIKDHIENDIIVVEDPDILEGECVQYLPHHAVVGRDKQTTKLCVVSDASAKSSGPSLNDCLRVGSKFNQRILEILIRFRCHNNSFIADVEKAFLMVQVHVRDRDVLHFLLVANPFQDPLSIKVFPFKWVTFGVTASPFLLNATLRYHIEGFKEDNCRQVIALHLCR